MRTIAAALCCASLLLLGIPAMAQQPVAGEAWRETFTATGKLAYAAGLIHGLRVGGLVIGEKISDERRAEAFAAIDQRSNGLTPTLIRDGIDAFYSDFRNRRIDLYLAAYVVLAQIGGRPQAEIDAMIERMRQ